MAESVGRAGVGTDPAQVVDTEADEFDKVAVGDLGRPARELLKLWVRQQAGRQGDRPRLSGLCFDEHRFERSVAVCFGGQAVAPGCVEAAVAGDLGDEHHVGAGTDQICDAGVPEHVSG